MGNEEVLIKTSINPPKDGIYEIKTSDGEEG